MSATHAYNLKKTYAQIAAGYDQKHQEMGDTRSLERFIADLKPGANILDLGAGTGREGKWLSDKGFQVTMFDLSPEMLAIAQQKVPQAKIIVSDMTTMEFEPESFDGVIARASLLHLTKQEAKIVVAKVYDMLTTKGVFFCTLKEGEGEKEVIDAKYGQDAMRFFSFYTQPQAEELLEHAGFKKVESLPMVSNSGINWVQVWGKKL